ncbi:MAG: two-component regulator propeller domain-containing protein, partial [Bacteroidota bacterium]
QYGLNSFDGERFRTYTYHPDGGVGLSANWVRSIANTSDNNIILGIFGGGINLFNHYQYHFSELSHEDIPRSPQLILTTPGGEIWVSGGRGISICRQDGSIQKIFNQSAIHLQRWPDGQVLATTRRGILLFEANGQQQQLLHSAENVNAAVAINDQQILFFKNDQLHLLQNGNNKQWSSIPLSLSIDSKPQQQFYPFIYPDRQGYIWTSGDRGFWRLSADLKTQTFFPASDFLPAALAESASIHCFLQDRNNNYWIGTNHGLIKMVRPLAFYDSRLWEAGHRLPNTREICSLNEDYFFATRDSLYHWSPDQALKPLLAEKVFALKLASDGNVYGVGVHRDGNPIYQIDPGTQQVRKVATSPIKSSSAACWKIDEDKKGRLWMAMWNHIVAFDLRSETIFPVFLRDDQQDSIRLDIIDLLIDHQDQLWIASISRGLIRIPNISRLSANESPPFQQYLHEPNDPNSLSSGLIQTLYESQDSSLWIGTDGGLNRFAPKDCTDCQKHDRFERWLRNDQMPDDKILAISEDD